MRVDKYADTNACRLCPIYAVRSARRAIHRRQVADNWLATGGNRNGEFVSATEQFVDIQFTVKAAVEDEIYPGYTKKIQRLHGGFECCHVIDVAGYAPVVGRKTAVLSEQHRQVDLR